MQEGLVVSVNETDGDDKNGKKKRGKRIEQGGGLGEKR